MTQRSLRQIIAIRRSIAARTVSETVVETPAAPKAKRPMSDKQALVWNTVIRPSLEAGRARKAAERLASAEAEASLAA